MKQAFYLLLFLPFLLLAHEKKMVAGIDENKCLYNLSMCAIFQDEAPFLREWIEYHRIVGVEHFYLYNNNSRDDYLSVLAPYLDNGIVELFDWPSPPLIDWTPFQKEAYNNCIKRSVGKTRWLAIVDIDEFIVPLKEKTIQALLKKFDTMDIGGLMCYWQFFGTSHVEKLNPEKPLIAQLNLKAEVNHPWNNNVKTICKPHTIALYQVHGGNYKPGFLDVSTRHTTGPQPIILDQVQINHYWTRDEDYCYNVKIPRRERCEGRTYQREEMDALVRDFNLVQDTAIQRFVPELENRLRR